MSQKSQGDPRVLFVMNVVLSVLFASLVVWGASLISLWAFTPVNVALATGVFVVLTHFVVMR
ncbi:hypothetical protein [Haladaptatus sp. DYSN1]|uniref:hypothetical protein n=1 Tax=unclassified Haladaptatus TaxID=2622732 RepID=UPI0024062D81|nr:hypothetical protein [Haladaptatus sp. DYSN1]